MTTKSLHVRKGDKVIILSGKDIGKKGKVVSTFPREGKVMVEGVNIVKKHAKPTQKVPQGGIREMEKPFPSAKAMVVCPACDKPTRVGRKKLADGLRVRICKKCSESLDE